ncbi:MAG: hypothetical protein LZF60_160184 [Nitrospira sp.]|nr:MAG: hypothetical protein LZF60_160184 [Nitrospira sp.]
MNREANIVRHGRVTFVALMTKMNGMSIRGRFEWRINDQHQLVDELWMTCARLVKEGGYLRILFLAASYGSLRRLLYRSQVRQSPRE